MTEVPGVHVVGWNWEHVGIYLTIIVFLVLSGLAKIGFHHAKFLSSRVPESCMLVIAGVIMGAIVGDCPDCENTFSFPKFTPTLFFNFLLPPIILESAYSLYDRSFFDNLSTILFMAIIGTTFNFLAIGGCLYLVYYIGGMGSLGGLNLSLVEVMIFASLISAVDPVAVLAIFQEVGVNTDLYFLLFGESLLNDGIAVVFYKLMNTFGEMEHLGLNISIREYGLGILSFITVAFGGLIIGIIVGFLTALITKCTTEVRVMEPLAVFGLAYLSYFAAELFHWSGIISLIGCGLIQAHYSFKNISHKSYTTVKYFIKMMSSVSDVVIFIFLGIAFIKGPYMWHTSFVLWTLGLCLVCRFIGVYGLIHLLNTRRICKINLKEQFIMAYGGLRGAVGFSLVNMLDEKIIPSKSMFETTTLAVVMFTIFFQGGTIKGLVNLLHIDKKKDEGKVLLSEEVNTFMIENLMAGIEIISGRHGHQWFWQLLEHYDGEFLMKWFCKNNKQADLTVAYEKLALSDHLCNLYGPATLLEDGKTKALLESYKRPHATEFEDIELQKAIESGSPSVSPQLQNKERRSFNFTSFASNSHRGSLFKGGNESQDIEIGPIKSSQFPSTKKEDLKSLRLAFNQNPYKRLHQKYNPNLIGDEDQEVNAHLRKRRSNARRMSMIALSMAEPNGASPLSYSTKKNLSKTRHISMMGKSLERSDSSDGHNNYHTVHLSGCEIRPGLESILYRQNQRVRSMSFTKSEEPLSQGVKHGQEPLPLGSKIQKDLTVLKEE